MQVPGRTRSLTDKETKCLRLLEVWELMVDDKKVFGEIIIPADTLDYCHRLKIAQPMRVTKDRETSMCTVRFSLIELHKYIQHACDCNNVVENLDGTMTTHDGITVPIKFKQPPLMIKKARR